MSSNRDDDEPVSGDLMRGEEGRVPVIRALFVKLSRLPFKNFWERKKIISMREVIKEETGFAEDFVGHQRSVNRLLNVRTIIREDNAEIESKAVEAENRLAAAKREEAAREKEDAIFQLKKDYEESQSRMRNEYELKRQEMEYQKRLHALEREMEELRNPPPSPPPGRGQAEKQKLRDRAWKRYEREIQRIDDLVGATAQRKTALKRAATNDREQELERIENLP